MAIEVRVPTILRPYTKDEKVVTVEGATIAEVIEDLERQYPGIGARVLDDSGELRRFVNLYVNDEDVRFLGGLQTTVSDGDTVTVLPAVAGG